nr:MAG TPA: hypothetical protein [Caudoviricetes sp.]
MFLFDPIKAEKARIHAGFPDVYPKCTENDHSSEYKVPIYTNLYFPIAINGLIWYLSNTLRDSKDLQGA